MNDTNQLADVLKKLHAEIAALSGADEDSRRKLEGLADDLEKKIITSEHGELHENLIDQVQDSILSFEVSHPALTATLNDIMIKLVNMGI
jgi:uncharacterized protein DUF4404